MKSWCVPFKKDGVWTTPWLLHTGHASTESNRAPPILECCGRPRNALGGRRLLCRAASAEF
eukprot:1159084-Prymnesium_polylepis.1